MTVVVVVRVLLFDVVALTSRLSVPAIFDSVEIMMIMCRFRLWCLCIRCVTAR